MTSIDAHTVGDISSKDAVDTSTKTQKSRLLIQTVDARRDRARVNIVEALVVFTWYPEN